MANCYNESNLNKNVVHKGRYDRTTVGQCGIKKEWIGEIEKLTKDNINSLYGGYLVLDHLIKKSNGDIHEAIRRYKGAKKNFSSVTHTLALKSVINSSN